MPTLPTVKADLMSAFAREFLLVGISNNIFGAGWRCTPPQVRIFTESGILNEVIILIELIDADDRTDLIPNSHICTTFH
jgi:hypothetical protein